VLLAPAAYNADLNQPPSSGAYYAGEIELRKTRRAAKDIAGRSTYSSLWGKWRAGMDELTAKGEALYDWANGGRGWKNRTAAHVLTLSLNWAALL